jgi:hypothetical protein
MALLKLPIVQNHRMRMVILLVAIAIVPMAAHAEWVPVDQNGHAKVYVDPATIRVVTLDGKKYRRAWLVEDQPEPTFEALSTATLVEVDCAAGKLHEVQSTFQSGPMGTGDMVGHTATKSWMYPPPSSTEAAILDFLCEHPI